MIDSADGRRIALERASLDELVAGVVERIRERPAKAMRWASALCVLDDESTIEPLLSLIDDPRLRPVDRLLVLDSIVFHALRRRVPPIVLGKIVARGDDLAERAANAMLKAGLPISRAEPPPASLALRTPLTARSLPVLLGALAGAEPDRPATTTQAIEGEPAHWDHELATTVWKAGELTLTAVTESHTHRHEGGGAITTATITSPAGQISIPATLDRFELSDDRGIGAQLANTLSQLGWVGGLTRC